MNASPLLNHNDPGATLAMRQGCPITVAQFLNAVHTLAERLPDRRYVANLYRDRYSFTIGFAAALVRGQVTLLPPNELSATLDQLARDFPGLYALAASATDAVPFPVLTIPEEADKTSGRDVPRIADAQPAVMLFTSGSTGRSKPHIRRWGMLRSSTEAASRALALGRWPRATVIGTVPAQHSFGLEATIMLPLRNGFAFQAARPFFPADVVALLAATPRPRLLVTTPIHLQALLRDNASLPDTDLVLSATAPLATELAAEAEHRFGGPLHEIYGCTEAGQIAVRQTVKEPAWRCIEGLSLRQDGQGTWVRGDGEQTEILLNDVIELEDDKQFTLHGRAGDLVNIAGKRSTLGFLTHQLNAIPGVRDGVFVMPSETEGQMQTRLMAFVVAPSLSAEDVLNALRQRLDPAFLPRPLRLVDELPRNALGKLPRDQILRLVSLADAR